MKKEYQHIFEPFTVRRMTMKNRIMMTPMGTNYGESSGEMSFLHINYYEQRAKGGVGLIMVENASVDSPEGSNGTTQLRIDHDNYLPRLFKLTETVHKHGACIGIQINHAQRLHRRCVQDHVVQLGIVVRYAQGDFALSQRIHQPSGTRLARQGKINFTLNARRAAQRVALNRRVQRLKTARGIMKMRDGFTQQAGVKIAQLHLKLTESRAALLKIRRIARRLQAKAALHKLHQAIAIALIVAAEERAVSRRHQGEHMAVVQALAAQMAGDQINVSHQELRIRKNGCIDALQDIIMRRISGYMIGGIDMPFAIGLTAQDTAFQVKGA